MGSLINFAEIARRFGGKSVLASHQTTQQTPQPQTLGSDYSEMARQFGGKTLIQTPPKGPNVQLPKGTEWDDPLTMAVGFTKGLLGGEQAPGVTPSGFGALFGAALPVAGGVKALRAAKTATTAENAVRDGIIAYHGSPHDFDRFSLDKIGTGEGAQAYGHGLYFAESEGVGIDYANKLQNAPKVLDKDGNVLHSAPGSVLSRKGPTLEIEKEPWAMALNTAGGNHAKALRVAKSELAKSIETDARMAAMGMNTSSQTPYRQSIVDGLIANKGKAVYDPGRRMYKVRINASPDEFLDWDKPLSEQSEAVRRSLEKLQEKYRKTQGESGPYLAPSATGKQALDEIINVADAGKRGSMTYKERQAAASSLLRKQGIKGVKYLDGASRSSGEGSRNYVVFDDSLIDILKKYGIALPALGMLSYEAKKNGGMVDLNTVNDPKYWKKEPPK